MATSGSVNSGGYQGRCLQFNWDTKSISGNNRIISYEIVAVGGSSSNYYHHNNTVSINDTNVYTGGASDYIKTGTVLKSGEFTINQSSTNTLTVKMHGGIYDYGDNINKEQTWNLDAIASYAKFTKHSISSTTLNSISISWMADCVCDAVQYSLNNGNWINTSDVDYTINGLEPNTTYTIKTKIRRKDSQLWTESSAITGTTKDIGKISSVNNFNHGDSTTINITNPSGSSLNLVVKIGDTQIQSKSVTSGNNTISFNDTELDNIYKKYGNSNTLTVTFILTTSGKYTNSKTCTATLKGNQKTTRNNVNNNWKRSKIWININGTWKRAVAWLNINGTWRRCI